MRRLTGLLLLLAATSASDVASQGMPSLEANVGQIPQTAPGAPWSFIGYAITPPASAEWFVTTSTPRGGAMGRSMSTTEPHSAVLVVASELLDQPVGSDNELLAVAKQRHARIGEQGHGLAHACRLDHLPEAGVALRQPPLQRSRAEIQ